MGVVGTPIAVKDSASLSAELTRIADICHGCRRCFTLCPSFEVLFKGLDVPEVDGEAPKLPKKVHDDFVDLCYECKLCLPHCPYIPPHRWAVDVPHLVLESRHVRRQETGLKLRERLLSNPDALGRLSSSVAPIANFMNTLPLARWAMEKTLAVQYLRFPIGVDPLDREALESGPAPVILSADHPGYRARAVLSPTLRTEIARDLVD